MKFWCLQCMLGNTSAESRRTPLVFPLGNISQTFTHFKPTFQRRMKLRAVVSCSVNVMIRRWISMIFSGIQRYEHRRTRWRGGGRAGAAAPPIIFQIANFWPPQKNHIIFGKNHLILGQALQKIFGQPQAPERN